MEPWAACCLPHSRAASAEQVPLALKHFVQDHAWIWLEDLVCPAFSHARLVQPE